jgi:para-aminobenzoate synthetase
MHLENRNRMITRASVWLSFWIGTQVSSLRTPSTFRRRSFTRLYEQREKFDLQLVLLDHYDSYTYNLYHILAELCNSPPIVLSKDFTGPLPNCDGLVLSPGPGRPQHEADMGRTLKIISDSPNLPILGVCLGHQALGHVYGASVELAPCGPVHGQVRTIRHEQGDELWKGISSPLSVVRYHSLVVENLEASPLVATAWCEEENGTRVLMGLSHSINPHYGVQFHPESIGTAEGKELLKNFCLICSRNKPPTNNPEHLVKDPPKQSKVASTKQHKQYKVLVHKISDSIATPSDVFAEFYGDTTHAVWLDSSSSDILPKTKLSRFSIMGANDGPLSELIEYFGEEYHKGGLFVTNVNGEKREYKTDILTHLERQSANVESIDMLTRAFHVETIEEKELPFDYRGGFLGYLGYEVRHDTQRLLDLEEKGRAHFPRKKVDSKSSVPTAAFLFCDQSIVYDHWKKEYYLIGLTLQGSNNVELIDWMEKISQRLCRMGKSGIEIKSNDRHRQPSSLAPQDYSCPSNSFLPNRSRKSYEMNINRCHEEIRNGETYELCLTNQLETIVNHGDPLDLYKTLRKRNPAPFSAFLRFENQLGANFSICCSSPERFISVKPKSGNATELLVEAKPIKGTAPRPRIPPGRVATAVELLDDRRRAVDLKGCIKNRAENLMIVDLLRNDMSRVCTIGSVHVPKLMQIESFATVHQMVSTIRGSLDPLQSNAIDVLKACFPGGSMTGAPKLRTMEILNEMENGICRGPYSGCLGYISINGCMDMNIIIRSAVIVPSQEQTGWKVSIGAGGAITALSESSDEYEEMILKATAVMEAVEEWKMSEGVVMSKTMTSSVN